LHWIAVCPFLFLFEALLILNIGARASW
jgi:hypothetical protein